MNLCKSFLGFLFWVIPFTITGQRYISGRITGAGNDEPIIGASVFIANTTVGVSTDADGHYRLQIPGEGSCRLTVSHVGYQPVFEDIEPGKLSLIFDVSMNTNELEEVTISTRVHFRQRDISLFWNKVLGRSPSKKTIYATNPESVFYYYNSETNTLKVTCREPLQIINNETGYQIQTVLNNFIHDYNTNVSIWNEQSMYTELEPKNNRQKKDWDRNRKKVYEFSITKFVKSLYHNSLMKDGFLLISRQKSDPQNPNFFRNPSILNPDSILLSNTGDNSKNLYLPGKEVILFSYGRPVNNNDIANILAPVNILRNWSRVDVVGNLLSGDSIRIFPDGTYTNRLYLTPMHSISLMGLNMTLPMEYHYNTTPLPECANHYASIAERFEQQLKIYPQEKLHLHTDRDFYVPGEKIWFKAYVVDAHSHLHPTYSQYMYVELISPADTLINRVMIRQTDDMFYGHLPLTEMIPKGNYTLRAYTRYMENLGDDFFFKKNIRIGNLAKNRENGESSGKRESRENQIYQINHTNHSQDFDVSFFPEGGNLLEGVFCKIAFKALHKSGYPETVSGKLIDEDGIEISSVNTYYAGMGIFGYTPVSGKRIYMKCSNANGLEKKFELPQPEPRALSLTASLRGRRYMVGLQRAINAPETTCYLLAHCRGEVLYFSEWGKNQGFISFPQEELPAGVIHFVLFDLQMNPVSERLVFNKNDDATAKVEFLTDKKVYEKRDKVIVTLSPSLWGRGGVGLSIAVTDDKDISVDDATTILSSLLLSSELKGYIENPAFYLQDCNESATALDYLMMTHGWRRYNITEVVKGNPEHPQIPFQNFQKISGQTRHLVFNTPVTGCEISLLTKDETRLISTDEKGYFIFQDLGYYPDSTYFYIQALNRKGTSNVKLVVNNELFPELISVSQSPIPLMPAPQAENKLTKELEEKIEIETGTQVGTDAAFIEKAEQRAMYDDEIRLLHLEEVVISAPRRTIDRNEPRLQFWANESSSKTIRRDEIERFSSAWPAEILFMHVAGARMIVEAGNPIPKVAWRGGGIPKILIDGIDREDLGWSLSANEIESIDVFKTGAVFGMMGANGVISITTRRGGDTGIQTQKFNYAIHTPLGYQKPIEFYSPKYETQEAKWSAIPDFRTTIFWKPDVVIGDENKASFEFYTADFTTTYSVVIEGITGDGRIVRQVEKIRVE